MKILTEKWQAAEGDRVRLRGLEKTPLLNGELGTIAGRKGHRVIVVLDASGAVSDKTQQKCIQLH